ncbi:polysaccharide pyruvyl transferase family protein [Rhodobacterales bacterium HKCCSP123]|nr:polysaccharide pyruvyl transferase family protein [Rhodobacterales bacterium HKCCSP123]
MTAVQDPIRLYHWPAPNFGDTLSQRVVAWISGRDVVTVRPKQAQLFAIGSLMHVLARFFADPPAHAARPILWGTGLLNPIFRREFVAHLDIRILRGPVGAAICRVPMREFGDPGLFAPEALGAVPGRRDQVAVIPHHSQMEDPAIPAMVARDPRLKLVDPRGTPEEVCAEIAASAHVFSASLHGLIVADAYGVANTWMDPGEQGRMKYHDYAASIGRHLLAPCEIAEVPRLAAQAATGPLPYADGIAQSRAALLTHFPAELKADTAMTVA